MARDGLIVRVRPTGGVLDAATALALADAAERWGNERLELTTRANLQLRGISQDTLPDLLAALGDLALLDGDAAGEAVRNVVASPLAGLHADRDIRPLVAALEARLAADVALHALPTKFGFLVDDGSEPGLEDVEADVRFASRPGGHDFAIGLGGTARTAVTIGNCGADGLVARAADVAVAALALFAARPDLRRMRSLLDALSPEVVARACGGVVSAGPSDAGRLPRSTVGRQSFEGVSCLGLAAPFGALDAAMLRHVAFLAARTPTRELRLTPWRTILVPGFEGPSPDAAGFILHDRDPRLAVAACVGVEGCERGTTPTRVDAARLAALLPAAATLHVSGCAKGCAKATPSTLTLVGRDGRYDLVRNGRAGDPPERRGLDLEQVRTALAGGPVSPCPIPANPMPANPMPASPMPASPMPASPMPA